MDESKPATESVPPKMAAVSVPASQSLRQREQEWNTLVRRMATGRQDALSRLYDGTSSVIYGLALRILRNREDAEEVVLDAYSRAWRQAANFDPQRGGAMTWLVMMARSIAIDRLRSSAGRAARTEPLDGPRQEASPEADPESSAFFSQQRDRVRSALAQLPLEQRQVIELAFFGGLSHSELATQLDLPLGTVKTRVRLGLGRLRTLLEEVA
jgi:RNA polymerase sigma-70 factor (ECF subfamily)